MKFGWISLACAAFLAFASFAETAVAAEKGTTVDDRGNAGKTDVLDAQLLSIRGTSDKIFYAPGETMIFSIVVDKGNQKAESSGLRLQWVRIGDDGIKREGRERVSFGVPATIATKLDRAGFVRIEAWLTDDQGCKIQRKNAPHGHMEDIRFDGGAGVRPEELRAAAKEPKDFDEFWASQKKRLQGVPVKAEMKKLGTTENVDVFAVSVACAGARPVTGYLTIPLNAKEKSLPAEVFYQGYGTYVQSEISDGPRHCIQLHMNAHGYEIGREKEYYDSFFAAIQPNGVMYAFDNAQNSRPEAAYFNGMALRVMRSLQFLKSLPQWNGSDLRVYGGSQGGLQSVWAAALDPDVSLAHTDITWCCDLAGVEQGRLRGWRPDYAPALNYYDPVFHARRIQCPIDVTRAGLGDYVCPPSGLAVLYNNIASKNKSIKWFQGSTHGFVPKNPQTLFIKAETPDSSAR